MRLDSSPYRPRDSERSVLYLVVDEHLDASLDVAVHHADGSRLPKFVEQECRYFSHAFPFGSGC